jgi:hypothetical protein
MFLNETADRNTLLGGAFILVAVIWNGVSRARRGSARTAPEPSG